MSDSSPPLIRAEVWAACQQALLDAIRVRGVGDADDIHSVVTIPHDIHPSIVGRAIGALSRDGTIVMVEYTTTSRPIGHAHVMRSWRLAEPTTGQSPPSTDEEGSHHA